MLRWPRRVSSLRILSNLRPQPSARVFNIPPMEHTREAEDRRGGRNQDTRKMQFQSGRGPKRQRTRKERPVKEGSSDEILLADVRALFAAQKLSNTPSSSSLEIPASAPNGTHPEDTERVVIEDHKINGTNGVGTLPEPFTEIDAKVLEISSTGDGLAVHGSSNQIYVIPFSVPGDIVRAKVIRHFENEHYSQADFVSVVEAGPLRDDTRVNCKYFSKCSGCQFQMLDYSEQLKHKKSIVEKAYKNFSDLPPEIIPLIEDTIGSPLQYGYRTKLTPHFDGPPGHISKHDRMRGERLYFKETPNIGFMGKGLKRTLDIEDCPIGTDTVRMGMKRERSRVAQELDKYKKGATILLRESTQRVKTGDETAPESLPNTIKVTAADYTDHKSCITDNNATSTEYIDEFVFTNIAGSFFQNNNSILPVFTQYIRENILPPSSSPTDSPIKYLIDAYSGSGLFTITLSSLFTSSVGIDVSVASITSARENAILNKLSPSQCTFIAADAPELFKSVTYPKDETVVVIDPPRKGCDESFLTQLLKFGPRTVVYVSCNVHTQARDVGVLVRGMEAGGTRYIIESLRGFDFFPQTGHVEGVAVLSRVDEAGDASPIKEEAQPRETMQSL